MKLNSYLRVYVNNNIRHLFIKDQCEFCESKEDLHLHHETLFQKVLKETLNDLSLPQKDNTKDYSELELRLITDNFLGKHLQITYLTLCQECHITIHNDERKYYCINNKYKFKKEIQEEQRLIYNEKVLIPYLENNSYKKIMSHEKEELINKINAKENSRLLKSHTKLNEYLIENNINFTIIPRRNNDYRYWYVEKVSH